MGSSFFFLLFISIPTSVLGTANVKVRSRHSVHHTLTPTSKAEEAKILHRSGDQLCNQSVAFAFEDPDVTTSTKTMPIWDVEEVLDGFEKSQLPQARLRIEGIPCQRKGCCQHSLLVRPQDSDVQVLKHAIGEYTNFLHKLQNLSNFSSILEGGGNIGVATIIFANLFPDATIVVLEPHPPNCLLLKANTLAFPNVKVHCKGLWNKETKVAMVPGEDGKDWGWRIQEVPEGHEGAVDTTTVAKLLEEHQLDSFDFVKLDIEGAEFAILSERSDLSWLKRTALVAAEVHGWFHDEHGATLHNVASMMLHHGFHESRSGEYTIFAKDHLHSALSSPS